jgi:hypothetical protein
VPPGIPHRRIRHGGVQRGQTADAAQHEWQRDSEPEDLHRQLHDVDDRGRQQSASAEIRHDHSGADETSGGLRNTDHDGEDPRDADQLAGKNRDRSHQQQHRDDGADAVVVAPLEKIANRPQIVRFGDAPDARPDPQRQRDRADAGRTHPPPRGQPVAIAEAGGANRRSAADVRRQERREQQPGAQLTPGDEEVARAAHAPADPQAERNLRERVDDDDDQVGHAGRRRMVTSRTIQGRKGWKGKLCDRRF